MVSIISEDSEYLLQTLTGIAGFEDLELHGKI